MRSTVFGIVFGLCLLVPETGIAQDRSLVQGTVTDATSRRKVGHVTVRFAESLATVTDSRGRFEFKNVPAGTYHVRFSRIGYRPKTFDFPLAGRDAGDAIFMDVSLEPLPVQMEPVEVRGDTSTIVAYGRLADFYRRRRMSAGGRFLTRRDIERRNAFNVTDLLRTLPGAWVSYDRWGDVFISFRPSFRSRRCLPTVWLDGVRLPQDFGGIDGWVMPQDIEAIEVYNSGVTVPLEFSDFGGGCGAIAIWTR